MLLETLATKCGHVFVGSSISHPEHLQLFCSASHVVRHDDPGATAASVSWTSKDLVNTGVAFAVV
jgi:hypothetical protein